MQKPTKVLLVGSAIAISLSGAAFVIAEHADAKVDQAVAACKAADARRDNDPMKPWTQYALLCDPSDFYGKGMSEVWVSPQKEVRDAIEARGSNNLSGAMYGFSFLIAFLSFIPWAWYFLLRRLREVRDALVGR